MTKERGRDLRVAALVAFLLAPVPWGLAFGGNSASTLSTSVVHVMLLLILVFAPCLLTDPRQPRARVGALLLLAGALLLEIVAVWSLELAQAIITPWIRPTTEMIALPFVALIAPWLVLAVGLRLARSLRVVVAAATAAVLASIAPATAGVVLLLEPPRHAVTASGVAATLSPPDYSVRASRYIEWEVTENKERLFEEGTEGWRMRNCLGEPAGCPVGTPIPQGTLHETRMVCDALKGECEWIRTDRYAAPPLRKSEALLVDWTVEMDLEGRYEMLQIQEARPPRPRGIHPLLVAWVGGVIVTFLVFWAALAALLRRR